MTLLLNLDEEVAEISIDLGLIPGCSEVSKSRETNQLPPHHRCQVVVDHNCLDRTKAACCS